MLSLDEANAKRQVLKADLDRLRLRLIPVFVSATADLAPAAEALARTLPPERYKVFWYQHEMPTLEAPQEVLTREISRCDVFISLLGAKYGSGIDKSNPNGPSATQWELCQALARTVDWPGFFSYWNRETVEAIDDKRQKEFIEAIVDFRSTWASEYTSIAGLAEKVRRDLAAWAEAKVEELQRRLRRWRTTELKCVIAAACTFCTSALTMVALGWNGAISRGAVAGAVALAVFVVAVLFWRAWYLLEELNRG